MYRLAILAACIAFPLMAQKQIITPSAPNASAETRIFALQGGGKLKIDVGGSVKISAWDKEEVAIAINYRPGNNVEYVIVVDNQKDSLNLTTKYPPRRVIRSLRKSNTVISPALFDIELKVPSRTSCDIYSYILDIELNGVNGNHKLRTSKGNIEIKNINGNIDIRGNGNITLNEVNGNAEVKTWNENIFLGNFIGDTLKVNAQQGSITGNIKIIRNELNISAAYGNIALELPDRPNSVFKAYTGNGNIVLQVPWATEIEVKHERKQYTRKAKSFFSGKAREPVTYEVIKGIAHGKIGNGATKMNFRTSEGSIVIK